MHPLNLVLTYRLAGDDHIQIRGASRIKVDGRGGLMYYDVQSGTTERIEVGQLQSFRLVPVDAACSLTN